MSSVTPPLRGPLLLVCSALLPSLARAQVPFFHATGSNQDRLGFSLAAAGDVDGDG